MVYITKVTSRDIVSRKKDHAFGVHKGIDYTYRLHKSRHFELGSDVARWAWEHHHNLGRSLELLDVGTDDGILRKFTEAHPGSEYIRYEAVDIYPNGVECVYKHDDWKHHRIDLNHGMKDIPSNSFDVVTCDHVLEHVHNYILAMSELSRVLRPNGLMVVGVPIFPPGVNWIRKYVVPMTDRLFKFKEERHCNTWTKGDLIRDIKKACPDVDILVCRGFRIISGGLLKPLEHYYWWWQLNRWLGNQIPSCCIEIEIIARKRPQ